jgi:hypothetical protein
MDEATSLLFGLDAFRVADVVRVADAVIRVVIETVEAQEICPDCGRASRRVKDWPVVQVKDLPVAGQEVAPVVVAQAAAGVRRDGVCPRLVHPDHH